MGKSNQNETMMLLSRNTMFTTVLMGTWAVIETQAEECSTADPSQPDCAKGLACTFQKSCTAVLEGSPTCQYNCDAEGMGAAPGSPNWEKQMNSTGLYAAGKVAPLPSVEFGKANNETEVGVGDVSGVEDMEGTGTPAEAESTSGSSTTRIVSYLLLAVGSAAIIAGL